MNRLDDKRGHNSSSRRPRGISGVTSSMDRVSLSTDESEVVLILAPSGRDRSLTCELLKEERINAIVCGNATELAARIGVGTRAGAALIDECVCSMTMRSSRCGRKRARLPAHRRGRTEVGAR
jgi:hypothetical protein